MRILVKLMREFSGYLIILISCIFYPRRIKRSEADQAILDKKCEKFSLYQFPACPFCTKARRNIRRLNLKIIRRNAQKEGQYRTELSEKGGKIQVPCLRIEKNGGVEWLYESNEIAQFLAKEAGVE